MKRFLPLVFIVIVLSANLFGCSNDSEHLSLPLCGSYAVPAMFCSDLKGSYSSSEKLETDDYGRILFLYTAKHALTQQNECAYVICQKYDNEYVYFYEDICYHLGEATEVEKQTLKSQNDWNAPIDLSKASKRPNKSSFDLYIVSNTGLDYQSILQSCKNHFGPNADDIVSLTFMDSDFSGHELLLLKLAPGAAPDTYIVLVDQYYDIALMSITGYSLHSIDPQALSKFKTDNGWVK